MLQICLIIYVRVNKSWCFQSVNGCTWNMMPKCCIEELWALETFNSFLAICDFCSLLITFAISLEPDQDRQNVGPDLDPNSLTL